MMVETKNLTRWLVARPAPPPPALKPGLYHFTRDANGTYTRFHLRIDPDGHGTLLVNATVGARLSPSGALIAMRLLMEKSQEEVKSSVKRRFRGISEQNLLEDIAQVEGLISNLSRPGDNYPIINLEDTAISPYEAQLMAPMRADIPVTASEDMIPLLDRVWDVGIPNVTFVGLDGAPTHHLIRAVERAEDLGMIAGVRGRATDLGSSSLVSDLAQAGIDYIAIYFASAEERIHDALLGDGDHRLIRKMFSEIQEKEVAQVAQIPLVVPTAERLFETLTSLERISIANVNFFAIASPEFSPVDLDDGGLHASALPQLANLIEEWSSEANVRFVWQPPVLRDPAIGLELQVQMGPRCSDDLSVRIEPGGDVIPARGPYLSAGNILTEDWQSIWKDDVFKIYRDRIERPTRCEDCPGMAICAADCPREISGWSQMAGGIEG